MKIGYPCINRSIDCKGDRTFRLKSYSEEKLIETVENNLNCLEKMLNYNIKNNLLFFRITSDLIPFASHQICQFDWQNYFKLKFEKIRNELLRDCILHVISRDMSDGSIGDMIISDTHKNDGHMNLKLYAIVDGDVSIELPVEAWFDKLDGELERWVNKKAEELTAYSREELKGMDFRDLLDKGTRRLVLDMLRKKRRGKRVPLRYEFEIIRKDGDKRRAESSSSNLTDANGSMDTIAYIKDITERKQYEEALKEKLEELEKWYKLTVDRELKMIELKNEIRALANEINELKQSIIREGERKTSFIQED